MTDSKAAIAIRDLHWIGCADGSTHDQHCMYEIIFTGHCGGKPNFRLSKAATGGGTYIADGTSKGGLKDVAQKHHEKRILSFIKAAQGDVT